MRTKFTITLFNWQLRFYYFAFIRDITAKLRFQILKKEDVTFVVPINICKHL